MKTLHITPSRTFSCLTSAVLMLATTACDFFYTYRVSGVVRDQATGDPVPDLRVACSVAPLGPMDPSVPDPARKAVTFTQPSGGYECHLSFGTYVHPPGTEGKTHTVTVVVTDDWGGPDGGPPSRDGGLYGRHERVVDVVEGARPVALDITVSR
jgi:hypothetical protein